MTSVLLLVEYSELGPRVERLVRKDLEFVETLTILAIMLNTHRLIAFDQTTHVPR